MTAYQLSSTRLILERARMLLARQETDTDASELLGRVSSVVTAIAVAEAVSSPSEESARLLAEGRAVYERVRAWAKRRGIPFTTAATPFPDRNDTDRAPETVEILAAIADMKPGATEPPAAIMPALLEALEGPEGSDHPGERRDTTPTVPGESDVHGALPNWTADNVATRPMSGERR